MCRFLYCTHTPTHTPIHSHTKTHIHTHMYCITKEKVVHFRIKKLKMIFSEQRKCFSLEMGNLITQLVLEQCRQQLQLALATQMNAWAMFDYVTSCQHSLMNISRLADLEKCRRELATTHAKLCSSESFALTLHRSHSLTLSRSLFRA